MKRYLALQKILQTGSFSRAADELGYTQSAMSQAIASLEEELGIRLLQRGRSGVRLTPDGEELYPYIEQLIYRYDAMKEKAAEISNLGSGLIRMGTLSSISVNWLPVILQEFRKEYPGIDFVIQQGNYDEIEALIRTGAVDFGFVSDEPVEGIRKEVLRTVRMKVILPLDHPLAGQEVVPLAELKKDPFILVELGRYSEPLQAFASLHIRPRVRSTIADDYTIMSMVEAGMGVSILSEMVLQRANYNIAIRDTDPPVLRPVCIGWREPEMLPAAARRMMDFIRTRLDHLP